jgi:hypothetical protein
LSNHRLIKWFWACVEEELAEEERRLLLRFVTSCSRPPLMGFAHLHPQFSIRCVEISDDLVSFLYNIFFIFVFFLVFYDFIHNLYHLF